MTERSDPDRMDGDDARAWIAGNEGWDVEPFGSDADVPTETDAPMPALDAAPAWADADPSPVAAADFPPAPVGAEPAPVDAEPAPVDAEPAPLSRDDRSFAERFRGTPWGAPAPPPTPEPTAGSTPPSPDPWQDPVEPSTVPDPIGGERATAPPATGPIAALHRIVPNRLTGAGLALLGVTLLAGVVLALGGGSVIGEPAPTDTLPRVTGTPDPAAGRAAIEGFLAAIADKRLGYEVRLRGSTTLGGAETEIRLSGKVAGKRLDVRYVLERPTRAPREVRAIVVGSRVWARVGDSTTWRRLKARPADLPDVGVFGGLTDPEQLVHVDSGYRRGYRTEHLRTVSGWVSPMTTRALAAWPEAIVRRSVVDAWVLPDGRPVEIAYHFEAILPATPAYGTVSGSATLVYARFGEKVTVAPPK